MRIVSSCVSMIVFCEIKAVFVKFVSFFFQTLIPSHSTVCYSIPLYIVDTSAIKAVLILTLSTQQQVRSFTVSSLLDSTNKPTQVHTNKATHRPQTFNTGICHHSGRGRRCLATITSVWVGLGQTQLADGYKLHCANKTCQTICTSIIKHLRYQVHLFYIKHTGTRFAYLPDNLQTSSNGRWSQRASERVREK